MFCNDCGRIGTDNQIVCPSCGRPLNQEPHISDITSGNVAICDTCSAMNVANANFCRVCGHQMAPFVVPREGDALFSGAGSQVPFVFGETDRPFPEENDVFAEPDAVDAGEFRQGDDDYGAGAVNATFVPVSGRHESLLERLDRMERELDENRREPLPENALSPPDELDEHEEALKNIAYTLDSLITDLLEAEASEYAFPGFIQPEDTPSEAHDEAAPPARDAGKPEQESDKKSRRLQEILMVLTLIAAIFMVGLSFGLWGSFFFCR